MDELVAMYEELSLPELNSSVVSCIIDINKTKADIKDYSAAGRTAIKELEERVAAILTVIKKKKADTLTPTDG